MLQTLYHFWRWTSNSLVSSPQGNATNSLVVLMSQGKSRSFKSPRECYKRVHGETCTMSGLGVSSPQGNATNQKLPRWGYRSSPPFQVPKGMLQTFSRCPLPRGTMLRFKSPRECYKQPRCPRRTPISPNVSSPQGNATNMGILVVVYPLGG